MAALSVRLAAAIVARYPRAWRERYADEMLSLLDDRGVTWRDVLDLASTCCSEWRVNLADPDEHPLGVGLLLTGSPMVTASALAWTFDAIARVLVPLVDQTIGAPDPPIRSLLVVVLVVAPPLLFAGRMFLAMWSQARRSTRPSPLPFTRLETGLWMILLFGGALSLVWNGARRFDSLMFVFTLGTPLLSFTGDRVHRMAAYQSFKTARRELANAERELSREQSRSTELASDRALRRAQADVDRLNERIKLAHEAMRKRT